MQGITVLLQCGHPFHRACAARYARRVSQPVLLFVLVSFSHMRPHSRADPRAALFTTQVAEKRAPLPIVQAGPGRFLNILTTATSVLHPHLLSQLNLDVAVVEIATPLLRLQLPPSLVYLPLAIGGGAFASSYPAFPPPASFTRPPPSPPLPLQCPPPFRLTPPPPVG